ncbi:IucA/IucC family protein [Cryptosporangium aurantiacum]|uniref:Siderophore synthetase component n=1 Tax=Cryptosporangium aurantiacum TaxID=134849 RepID=A0A1M7N5J5_9ACTN|nr:IucA/IucC family protein [Cryptosporangium aurantiacum]SHM98843.1 Siderophore synthetase component [Cryptosporangium aurantiacum]
MTEPDILNRLLGDTSDRSRTTGTPRTGATALDGAANGLAVQALLRCWVREARVPVPARGATLEIPLHVTGTRVEAEVRYWSATGWHRFGPARFPSGTTLDATVLATLLATEANAHGSPADLVEQVIDSTRRLDRYLRSRAATPNGDPVAPFLVAEQALVAGHPLHPTPKSRPGLSDLDELGAAPELRGAAPLHWFAVERQLVRHGSATGVGALEQLAALAPRGLRAPDGMALIPAHFRQARSLLGRADVQDLIGDGRLCDLGPCGPAWSATSSVRTLYRADAPRMLKLSLGVRITNSRREHLVPELIRGAEMYRLVEAGLGEMLAAAHPRFRILGDPAWAAVPLPTEDPTGQVALAVSLRDNPFGPDTRAVCVAGLVAERPDLADSRSGLAVLIEQLALSGGRPVAAVAVEWLRRYVDEVIAPVAWLHGVHGLGLEAHQQNTLVTLDPAGWPVGGWYRDNQGYYLSPTRAGTLHTLVHGLGAESDATNPDDVIDERVAYYVGVNNLLGLIGAIGSSGLADEVVVLRAAVAALESHRHGFVGALLDAPELPCKANLLTRVAGLDELVGPVETQSVYVRIPNPLWEVRS